MLDVAHYFLEEDFSAASTEQADARSRLRTTLYESLYDKEYKFKTSQGRKQDFDIPLDPPVNEMYPQEPVEEPPTPFNPSRNNVNNTSTSKKYMEPTIPSDDDILPFGEILDSPMN